MIPTPEQIQAARDDLARFERVPADGSQHEWRPVAADSLRVALAAMDEACDNADAAEELAREADAERKAVEVALATVTRERDEARATVVACQDKNRFLLDTVVAQHQADAAEARRERDILRAVNADAWTEVKALLDDRDVALAFRESAALSERDELRAALLNERGLGSGPSEGWAYRRGDFDETGEWFRPGAKVWIYEGEWSWGVGRHGAYTGDANQPPGQTAREAMRAADAALAGAKS